ncbi:hypothetical protein DF182_20340 [Chitinophaga flava]|uniref:Uncharacterized protein n=2 Tax=Chitinophaga flava TaxID=2259036 RepID=A0A365XSA4_9BACT|nr:hypothetical protein DF182_20340 [Chitinophaga flava]
MLHIAHAQIITAKRVQTDSLRLKNVWVKGVMQHLSDIPAAGTTLPTAKAVKDYIDKYHFRHTASSTNADSILTLNEQTRELAMTPYPAGQTGEGSLDSIISARPPLEIIMSPSIQNIPVEGFDSLTVIAVSADGIRSEFRTDPNQFSKTTIPGKSPFDLKLAINNSHSGYRYMISMQQNDDLFKNDKHTNYTFSTRISYQDSLSMMLPGLSGPFVISCRLENDIIYQSRRKITMVNKLPDGWLSVVPYGLYLTCGPNDTLITSTSGTIDSFSFEYHPMSIQPVAAKFTVYIADSFYSGQYLMTPGPWNIPLPPGNGDLLLVIEPMF